MLESARSKPLVESTTTLMGKTNVLNNTFKSFLLRKIECSFLIARLITSKYLRKISLNLVYSLFCHHKAGSPDHIPARVLKELAYDLTPMITHKQSLDVRELPQE